MADHNLTETLLQIQYLLTAPGLSNEERHQRLLAEAQRANALLPAQPPATQQEVRTFLYRHKLLPDRRKRRKALPSGVIERRQPHP